MTIFTSSISDIMLQTCICLLSAVNVDGDPHYAHYKISSMHLSPINRSLFMKLLEHEIS